MTNHPEAAIQLHGISKNARIKAHSLRAHLIQVCVIILPLIWVSAHVQVGYISFATLLALLTFLIFCRLSRMAYLAKVVSFNAYIREGSKLEKWKGRHFFLILCSSAAAIIIALTVYLFLVLASTAQLILISIIIPFIPVFQTITQKWLRENLTLDASELYSNIMTGFLATFLLFALVSITSYMEDSKIVGSAMSPNDIASECLSRVNLGATEIQHLARTKLFVDLNILNQINILKNVTENSDLERMFADGVYIYFSLPDLVAISGLVSMSIGVNRIRFGANLSA